MRKGRKDEWAYVLDYLPKGYPSSRDNKPVAQVIGTYHFTLLEVTPKPGVSLEIMEKIYIGEGKRDKIMTIVKRIPASKLTASAYAELPYAVEKIVEENEERFVEFINTSMPLTTKLHQLELLPGIGKKHMWEIVKERKRKPFESFEDVKSRLPNVPDIKKAIIKRILEEIEKPDLKWYLFVPKQSRDLF